MAEPAPLAGLILHPVRLRIIQQLSGRQLTTAELRSALPDVSQATLYRHVAALVSADVVAIVEERRVRGAVERTLALGSRTPTVDAGELHRMESEDLRRSFLSYIAHLSEGFDRFAESGDPGLRDYLGFGSVPLYVSTDDLAAIQRSLGDLLAPYLVDRGDDRQRVSLSTVLLPEPAPAVDTGPDDHA
jgi:DNA-binding transcriptional ArsR family regulator